MKVWFHMACMFESLTRARATTKKIESPADLEGFSSISDEDKEEIKKLIKGNSKNWSGKVVIMLYRVI